MLVRSHAISFASSRTLALFGKHSTAWLRLIASRYVTDFLRVSGSAASTMTSLQCVFKRGRAVRQCHMPAAGAAFYTRVRQSFMSKSRAAIAVCMGN